MPKRKLRQRLIKKRAAVSPDLRSNWDHRIKLRLLSWPPLAKYEKIMIYLSFGWEINTWPLVEALWLRQKRVFAPVVEKSKRALTPTLYTGETVLASGDFGIQEPVDSPTIAPEQLDLVLVPGLAFSTDGYRLGFGGGYYDRFLTGTQAVRVGLCYSQFIQKLPRDVWDQPMHFLATEEGVQGRK